MLTDGRSDAPAARRLAAFGATFLGLITLSNVNYAGGTPLVAPPAIALVVILSAVGGLLIWVNNRYSRAALWLAAGVALFTAAGSAVVFGPPGWLALTLMVLGLTGLVGTGLVVAAILKPSLAPFAAKAPYVVVIAGLLLALAAAPIGPGPVLALVAAGALMAIVALLRPVEEEQD